MENMDLNKNGTFVNYGVVGMVLEKHCPDTFAAFKLPADALSGNLANNRCIKSTHKPKSRPDTNISLYIPAVLCSAAYETGDRLKNQVEGCGCKLLDTWERYNFRIIVAKRNQYVFLSFRGTDNLENILFDVLSVGQLNSLLTPFLGTELNSMANFIREQMKKYGGSNLVLCGHSLGGFLTQLFCLELDVRQGYTFNAPPLANFRNDNRWVPVVDCVGLGVFGNLKLLEKKKAFCENHRIEWDPVSSIRGEHYGPLKTHRYHKNDPIEVHKISTFVNMLKP